jgi:hypothetical protein
MFEAEYTQTMQFGSGLGLFVDIGISFFFWSTVQLFLVRWPDLTLYQISPKTELDLRNRMVSFIHGLVCLVFTTY